MSAAVALKESVQQQCARLQQAWAHRGDPVDAGSVAVVRVAMGVLIGVNALKILTSGEIDLWSVAGEMRMTYQGFGWVKPWPGAFGPPSHLTALAMVAALFACGVAYRVTSVLLFVLFTHLFLLEQSLYLNHFYLIGLFCLFYAFIPAHRRFALLKRRADIQTTVPRLAIWVLRLQLFIVYFYAGLMKLNADWLAGAPVDLWFADTGTDGPFGALLSAAWLPVAVAWSGAAFDLVVPVLLLTRFRGWAFGLVLAFHGLNHFLWDIGIFPFFGVAATTLFFAPDWPRRLAARWVEPARTPAGAPALPWWVTRLAVVYCVWQLLFPFRMFLYPGQTRWTAQGAKFAWRMKLDDRRGFAMFIVEDKATGARTTVHPRDRLNYWQVWKLAEDPEMVLQFAHHLRDEARAEGRDVAVYVHMFVSLNGREQQMYVVPTVDLAQVERSFAHKDWIVPLVTPLRDAIPSDFSGRSP